MAEEKQENPQTNNEDAVAQLQEMIRSSIAEELKKFSQPQEHSDQDRAREELKRVIDPIYKNDFDVAKLNSASAIDESRFYRKNPDAVGMEDKIEEMFVRLAQAGRATSRTAIYEYLLGQEVRSNPDAFVEKLSAKKKAELQKATNASDFGGNSVIREKVDSLKDFDKLSLEELETKLEGITF